jgi:hypothetical protein
MQLLHDLTEKENAGNSERKQWMALCGKLALEEAVGLS